MKPTHPHLSEVFLTSSCLHKGAFLSGAAASYSGGGSGEVGVGGGA